MKQYTVRDVMKWKPCYSRKEVRKLFAGRKSMNIIDCLTDKNIREQDKAWIATRDGVLPEKLRSEFLSNVSLSKLETIMISARIQYVKNGVQESRNIIDEFWEEPVKKLLERLKTWDGGDI